MKKVLFIFSVLVLMIACKKADNANKDTECDKVYNTIDAVNPWGVLMKTTCTESGGDEPETVALANGEPTLMNGGANVEGTIARAATTRSVSWWFLGTQSGKLFMPVVYARVYVFNDDATDNAKITAAQTQITNGDHYLGFDRGVFMGIYPYGVYNITRKQNATTYKIISSYNLESEIKKTLPIDKKIFIQFIVQLNPLNVPATAFNSAKYAYLVFKNSGAGFPHYKIDMGDYSLGYQNQSLYYN